VPRSCLVLDPSNFSTKMGVLMRELIRNSILIGSWLALAPFVNAQGLEGSQVTLTVDYPQIGSPISEPNVQTVGSGLEYPAGSLTALPGFFIFPINLDVGANSIDGKYTNVSSETAPTGTFNGYVFDLGAGSPNITGATIDPSTTFAPGTLMLGFSAHEVTINVEGLTIPPNSSFLIDLKTAAVPEPPSQVLLLAGVVCTGVILGRRRRNQRAFMFR
jgi:hypothetical protein